MTHSKMIGLLPEPIIDEIFKGKHNLEYAISMKHIKMFKQYYDDIPRYVNNGCGDRFSEVKIDIPIKTMLIPLNKNIIEIDTSNTTQFDGEYNFLYRGEKYMKRIEVDMNVKIKVDAYNFVYGVNGGRRYNKIQIKWLNKQNKAMIGDVMTIIKRLRLESVNDGVSVVDVNIKTINKLKQCVDLSFKNKFEDDDGYNNLFGLIDTPSGSDDY